MQPTAKAIEYFKENGWTDDHLEAQGYLKEGEPLPAILDALASSGWTPDKLVEQGLATKVGAPDLPKADEKVARYIGLRDEIDAMTKALKEKVAPLKAEMEEIELDLATVLNAVGQTKMGSDAGTFYFVDKAQVGMKDFDRYQVWFVNTILNRLTAKGFLAEGKSQYDASDAVMDAIGLNFMTQAVRKDAVTDHQKEYGEIPPGINVEIFQEVQVRRAAKK